MHFRQNLAGILGVVFSGFLFRCASAPDGELFAPPANGDREVDATTGSSLPGTPNEDAAPSTTKDSGDAGIGDANQGDVRAPIVDASPETTTSVVQCGQGFCNTGKDVCCRVGTTYFTYGCVAKDKCDGVAIPCDDTTDCRSASAQNSVCCATLDAGRAVNVACRTDSLCQGRDKIVLCDKAHPEQCTNGYACRVSASSLPTYYGCFEP